MAQTADNSCGIRIGRMRWASIRRSLNDIPRSFTPHHCSHCSASDIGLTTHTGSESRAHLRSGRCEPNSKTGYGARTRGHPPKSSKHEDLKDTKSSAWTSLIFAVNRAASAMATRVEDLYLLIFLPYWNSRRHRCSANPRQIVIGHFSKDC